VQIYSTAPDNGDFHKQFSRGGHPLVIGRKLKKIVLGSRVKRAELCDLRANIWVRGQIKLTVGLMEQNSSRFLS